MNLILSGQVGVAQVTLMVEITCGLCCNGLLSIYLGSSITTHTLMIRPQWIHQRPTEWHVQYCREWWETVETAWTYYQKTVVDTQTVLFGLVCSGLFLHWPVQSKIHFAHFTCFSLLCNPHWELARESTSPQKSLNVTPLPSSTPMSFRSLFSPSWSPAVWKRIKGVIYSMLVCGLLNNVYHKQLISEPT